MLELVAGDRGHRLAGRRRAGDRRGDDAVVAQDALDVRAADEQGLERVGREAGAGEDVLHVERGLRHVAGVLEQPDVAREQCRGREAHGLPQREVPRHDRQHRTERLPADVRPRGLDRAGVDLLVGQDRRAVLGVVAAGRGALEDLGLRRLDRLAHLEGHERGRLVRLGLQQVGRGPQPSGPLLVRRPAVGAEGHRRPLEAGVELLLGQRVEGLHDLAGRGVGRGDRHARSWGVVLGGRP